MNKSAFRLAITPTLVVAIGVLVFLSVGAVLALNWVVDRRIAREFTSRLITRALDAQERSLRSHLDAAVYQSDFIAAALKSGRYTLSDPKLTDFLLGTLAGAPQVDGLIVGDADGVGVWIVRGLARNDIELHRFDTLTQPQLLEVVQQLRSRKDPYWGPPVYSERQDETYLNYRVPIWNGDAYLGFAIVGISTRALSRLTKELSEERRATTFMLYGRDRVLAHPLMAQGRAYRSASESFPSLDKLGDPVIARLGDAPPIEEIGIAPPPGVTARAPLADGESYFAFTQAIGGYNELPIVTGIYVLRRAVDAPLRLFYLGTFLAIALLAAALIAAAVMATAIARPIRRAAVGAAAIGQLDFDQVAPLSASMFREIDSLAHSFNAMLDALRAFGRYVPRSLVMLLLKEGRVGTGSEERELAIMFTDIVSFTSTCETMSATEVADFINMHLSLIAACVEAEGGTIDKFIGDAVMAFWGAPGRIDNPAAAACRAALRIQRAIAADNKARAAAGSKPVRVRIGLHLGRVVVGDIGTPNRINYTVVGDAVNATQRLESLGKTIDPNAEAIALVSSEIFAAVPKGFEFIARGSHLVKGKQESLDVYQLVGDAAASGGEGVQPVRPDTSSI